MVSFEKEPYLEVFNESNSDGLSICRLLHETDFYSVVKHIETKCYTSDSSHFRYPPEFMVKLVVLRAFRGQSFRKTIASLTTKDCKLLSAPKKNGHYLIPSPSTLHHFMRYRLDEKFFEEIIRIAGAQLARLSGEKDGIIDSTPLEASRYDRYADFNTHYNCKIWRKGGSIKSKINEKLRFLYENGRTETVGMGLRNQSMMDPHFEMRYGMRGDCERTHSHIHSKFWILTVYNIGLSNHCGT